MIHKSDHWSLLLYKESLAIRRRQLDSPTARRASKEVIILYFSNIKLRNRLTTRVNVFSIEQIRNVILHACAVITISCLAFPFPVCVCDREVPIEISSH